MDNNIIWRPSGDYLHCRFADFMHLHGIEDWRELLAKSQQDIEWFWSTFGQYAGVQWHTNYNDLVDQSHGFAWAKWFVGGKTNIAYNCLDWHLKKGERAGVRTSIGAEQLAVIWQNEEGGDRRLTYGELNELAGKVASLLKHSGIAPGDSVGIYMPMVPEVVAVLFGCFKVGAVAVPVFSGFGAEALANRMADCQAKIIFTADGGVRRGKLIEIKADVDLAKSLLPKLEQVVVVKNRGNEINWDSSKDIWFDQALKSFDVIPTVYNLDAEHPCLYLYTSGTTGKPKGTIHTHSGAMMQIAKEHGFAFDTKPNDVFFWITDIGWMMGPWEMIGATFWGATMVIYEGAPNYPNPDRIWQMVNQLKVTTLGLSPTVVRFVKACGNQWLSKWDLSTLKYLGSTGEPWDEESYMWCFEKIGGKRCPIVNISGGTELIGCFLMPLPVMPLKACSLGAPGLGMDIDVFDEQGKSVVDQVGHLVCKKPCPSMTKGFVGDKERYLETYFSRFPNMWYHGDWAKKDHDGQWFIYGRSDDTIKVAGKRTGPGEIESVLIEHDAVTEAAAIGVPHQIKGEELVCFVTLNPDVKVTDDLEQEIKQMVSKKLGAVLRPAKIHFVAALPKTRSGKIVRGAIRRQYLGEALGDISSIENPESLKYIDVVDKV